jgi:hypothetical protein
VKASLHKRLTLLEQVRAAELQAARYQEQGQEGRIQQASGPAVTTLLTILVDPNAQLAVKARSEDGANSVVARLFIRAERDKIEEQPLGPTDREKNAYSAFTRNFRSDVRLNDVRDVRRPSDFTRLPCSPCLNLQGDLKLVNIHGQIAVGCSDQQEGVNLRRNNRSVRENVLREALEQFNERLALRASLTATRGHRRARPRCD